MSFLFRLCLGFFILTPVLTQAAVLEIPGNGSTLSGIGVISGWKCEATAITVVIDGGASVPMLHGSERGDTRGVCGDTNNGFLAIFNWALLDDGKHTAVAYDNGVEFDRKTFEVGTLGEEFVRGASAQVRVEDFPSPGEHALLVWNQSSQHFEVAPESLSEPPPPPQPTHGLQELLGTWRFTYTIIRPFTQTYRLSEVDTSTGTPLIIGTRSGLKNLLAKVE